jgi:hypothetical protein
MNLHCIDTSNSPQFLSKQRQTGSPGRLTDFENLGQGVVADQAADLIVELASP